MARGDVSSVYLAAPLQGLFGAWMVPPPPLWVSLHAPRRILGDTEMAWLCIFAPQNFIDFLQQTGSEPNVRLPLGRETFLSFRGGQESRSVGERVLEPTLWEHVWTPRGGVCPEISA